MAKKNGEMKSHTLLKLWGVAGFAGLLAYLVTYDENCKLLDVRKKNWQIVCISVGIALLCMVVLAGIGLALKHFFFPNFSLDEKWIVAICCGVIVVIGTVVTVVEAVQKRRSYD